MTSASSARRPAAERAPARGQHQPAHLAGACRRAGTGRARSARSRPARSGRAWPRPVTSGPPAMSDSLLASATVRPASSAARVARRPCEPATAVEHDVGRPAREFAVRASGPGEHLGARPGVGRPQRGEPGVRSSSPASARVARPDRADPQPSACSASSQGSLPPAARPTTRNRSGVRGHHIDGLGADRPGRAEQDDAALRGHRGHGTSVPDTGPATAAPHYPARCADRPERRPRRGLRRAGGSATTRRCSTSSPAPTWPAASTPATRRPCAGSARLAAERGVAIGAQVGYRDLAGFGRRRIDMPPGRADRRRALPARRAGGVRRGRRARAVRYVKPHGALYNTAARRRRRRPARRRGGRRVRQHAAAARPARARGSPARPRRPGCPSSPRRSPTAPTRPTGGWCPARQPGARARRPGRGGRAGRAARHAPDGSHHRRRQRSRSAPRRCACTATRRARSTSRRRSARRWTTPASRSSAVRRMRLLPVRRARGARRGRRAEQPLALPRALRGGVPRTGDRGDRPGGRARVLAVRPGRERRDRRVARATRPAAAARSSCPHARSRSSSPSATTAPDLRRASPAELGLSAPRAGRAPHACRVHASRSAASRPASAT